MYNKTELHRLSTCIVILCKALNKAHSPTEPWLLTTIGIRNNPLDSLERMVWHTIGKLELSVTYWSGHILTVTITYYL